MWISQNILHTLKNHFPKNKVLKKFCITFIGAWFNQNLSDARQTHSHEMAYLECNRLLHSFIQKKLRSTLYHKLQNVKVFLHSEIIGSKRIVFSRKRMQIFFQLVFHESIKEIVVTAAYTRTRQANMCKQTQSIL